MFNKITTFSYVRTAKQALGFYIIYWLLSLAILIVAGMFYSTINNSNTVGNLQGVYNNAVNMGRIVNTVISVGLALLIVKTRKMDSANIILLLVTAVLAYFLGAMASLIPVAIMTTRK